MMDGTDTNTPKGKALQNWIPEEKPQEGEIYTPIPKPEEIRPQGYGTHASNR
jgi:hypothetical protein